MEELRALAENLPPGLCTCCSLLLEHPSPDTQYLTPSVFSDLSQIPTSNYGLCSNKIRNLLQHYLPSLPYLSSSPLTIPDTQYMRALIFVTCLPPHEMISYRKINIFAGVFHHCIYHP